MKAARPLLLVFLLVLVGVDLGRGAPDHHDDDVHHDDHDRDHDHDDDHGEDFDKIDHRLDKLTSRIEDIRDRIHQRVDPDNINKARSFQARVQKLEGSGCDDQHFQCGGTDPECQSYLFVCDGHKDCRNGADEAFCELPTKKGDYFEGHIIWDTCTQRKPDVLGLEVTNVKEYDYFTPVVKLHVNILLEYENNLFDGHVSLPAVGHYHLGHHTISVIPPEDDRLALFCEFDGFNQDRCDGHIAHEASGEVCAEFVFVRQNGNHHDDHHDNDHHDDDHHNNDHH